MRQRLFVLFMLLAFLAVLGYEHFYMKQPDYSKQFSQVRLLFPPECSVNENKSDMHYTLNVLCPKEKK